MPKAGEALFQVNPARYQNAQAIRYRLTFQTSKFFDAVYKMRDTIDCFYRPDFSLQFSTKRSDEGGYYLIDDLYFTYRNQQTSIHSHRYTPTQTKIDTVLTVSSSAYVFDMLGATFFIRTLDWNQLKVGNSFPLTVAIGRDLVRISLNYKGMQTLEYDNLKYRTHFFTLDIHDDAFTQKKAAAELWVGDDANHVPLKIRAKLKVGYAEAYYKKSSQLKAPFNCHIRPR